MFDEGTEVVSIIKGSLVFRYEFRFTTEKDAVSEKLIVRASGRNIGGESKSPLEDDEFCEMAAEHGEEAISQFKENLEGRYQRRELEFCIETQRIDIYPW